MTQTCSPRRAPRSPCFVLPSRFLRFRCGLHVDSALAQVRNPHGVAVIIGNKNYTGTGQVRFAHRDAKAFRRYVVGVLGFDPDNVIHLKDATQAQMVGLFGNRHDPKGKVWFYLDPDEGRKVSDVVVYYSGHGMPGLDNKTPGAYLLPTDANPNNPRLNGYSIDVLYRNLAKLPARSVSVFLDACFTGQAGDGQAILKASPIIRVAALPDSVAKNMTVLTAARKNQLAYWDEKSRHGMFTHHLLDALYGKGDADGDGKVTAKETQGYLRSYMRRAVRRLYQRDQVAELLDGSGKGAAVLSAAFSGGFPERPSLDGGTGVGKKDEKKEVAKVVKPPKPAVERKSVKIDENPKVAVGIYPKPVAKPRRAPGTVFRDCPECPEMVVVPAGSFMMGSPPSEKDRNDDEGPRHQVTIPKSFAVGKYEVTVEEYRRFAKATDRGGSDGCYVFDYHGNWPWRFKDTLASWQSPGFVQTDRHPVVCVSRKNASAYVRWLSQKTDKQYRLLSETEWEYVARAGTSTRYSWGEGVGRKRANCDGCGSRWDGRGTAPVGSFQANGFGVHDMHGNAWEWVENCRDYDHGDAPSGGRAHMNRDCAESGFRGGSWLDEPSYIRSACRSSLYVTYSYFSYVVGDGNFAIGLRIARTLAP